MDQEFVSRAEYLSVVTAQFALMQQMLTLINAITQVLPKDQLQKALDMAVMFA
jgi:hypothetical protein